MQPEEYVDMIRNCADSVYDTMQGAKARLLAAENEQTDLLHELELQELNRTELRVVAERLRDVLRERRIAKDAIEVLEPVIAIYEKGGVKSAADQAARVAQGVKVRHTRRTYRPRVRTEQWEGEAQ